VQALCLRNFFGCSGAGIDEVRKFQLSGHANHVCDPTPGHQILYLLRGWFFRGRWRLVLFKIHVVLKTRFGYFVLLTAEQISNRGNRAPSSERLSLLVSVAVVAVLIAVPETNGVAAPGSWLLAPAYAEMRIYKFRFGI
jgi:hypothetical protein